MFSVDTKDRNTARAMPGVVYAAFPTLTPAEKSAVDELAKDLLLTRRQAWARVVKPIVDFVGTLRFLSLFSWSLYSFGVTGCFIFMGWRVSCFLELGSWFRFMLERAQDATST